jgi:hypothetical protein
MTITNTPAPARTDVAGTATAAAPDAKGVRRAGLFLTAGALTWSAAVLTFGSNPTDNLGITITDLGALPFQLALFGLVTAQLRTGATGTSKVARGMLRVEYVLLTLATLWTVLHGAVPAFRDDLWLAVLDAFWPLSMLGMAIIGVKVALAGRWKGVARIWPMIAESWAVVTVPTFILIGPPVSDFVGGGHLIAGYAVLGLILATRTHLTGAR